ncbi:glycosyltransferase [Ancylobacter vacuolatus]|uniref:GT2 family glycosyltransferase n=1 Tax=Ancylobacter vacuolatus TaxID=223389 RepID=A0ABU0DCE7_9HYPH|nr:glycosyltransferase [Ancylobacter vacuolatus]MDQ0346099.1 GT2 family glycosyltransferase [Ancylobacter vacuolatus]
MSVRAVLQRSSVSPSISPLRLGLTRLLEQQASFSRFAPRVVVAVPARDEEGRIERCLAALAGQRQAKGGCEDFGVLVLANNCRDHTVPRARTFLAAAGLPHRVLSLDVPPAHANAGLARGLALDLAGTWVERGGTQGALLTTDADTVVAPDWLARNLAGLSAGCGAVAGRFELDPVEAAALPSALRRRRRIEAAYEAALLALAGRLDPLPHDPWPNHWTASGASFAVSLAAYRRIGGQPEVDVGEDRALAEALARHDIPIRHDPDILVTTSARLEGRASGGCAATLRQRLENHDLPGDDKLEALPLALHRMVLRLRLRRAVAEGFDARAWEHRLALPAGTLESPTRLRFGEAWARAEARSPHLAPRPLRPSQMELHLIAARELLRTLNRASRGDEQVQAIILGALLSYRRQGAGGRRDEELGSVIA